MNSLLAWHRHIDRNYNGEPLTEDQAACLSTLLASRCDEDMVRVSIADFWNDRINGADPACGRMRSEYNIYKQADHVADRLVSSPRSRVRVISIFSASSVSPLHITPELMHRLLDYYEVPAEFLSVLMSFGNLPTINEGSAPAVYYIAPSKDHFKLSYQIRYPEKSYRGGPPRWSIRQTGVYHSSSPEFDLFILLQPVPFTSSTFDELLRRHVHQCPSAVQLDPDRLRTDVMSWHSLVFSCHFDNWRWYFRTVGEEFENLKERTMVLRLDTTIKDSDQITLQRFKELTVLGNIRDKLLKASAFCSGGVKIAEQVETLTQKSVTKSELRYQHSLLRGYLDAGETLQVQVRNTIDLLGSAIMLQTQRDSAAVQNATAKVHAHVADLTSRIAELTGTAAKDSASISVITILSAFYVPGSFIGTIFGTNFFKFGDSGDIQVTNDFWIFLAIWLPLTTLTVAVFLMVVGFHKWKRGGSLNWPWEILGKGREARHHAMHPI